MKTFRKPRTARVWLPLALFAAAGCSQMSEQVRDPAAGTNGGFEEVQDGLPVNWLVYSPDTVPEGRYALRFWLKSEGCDWQATYGGVAAKVGELETIGSQDLAGRGWQHVEREFRLPSEFDRLRFELSITSPGTLWLDVVRIEPAGS